jgi:plastocyanin
MRRFLVPVILALVMAAMLISTPAASAQDAKTVSIQDFSFDPDQITVAPGTMVTWVNNGQAPHTVTSTDGKDLDSATLQPGDSYSFTFEDGDAGETYAYHCSIHPQMTASVKVSSGGGGGGASTSASASMSSSASASASPATSASASAPQRLAETGGISLPLVAAVALVGLGIGAVVTIRRTS